MRKRFLAVFLLLLLVSGLCACGQTSADKDTENGTETVQTEKQTDAESEETHADSTKAEEPTVTTSDDKTEEDRHEQGYQIQITVGDTVLDAVLEDNATTRHLLEQMPFTVPMEDLYSREMCYRYGANALPTDDLRSDGYEVGDIAYWPPRGSLVILYAQNGEEFERAHLGHIESGVEIFESTGNTDVTFSRADEQEDTEMAKKIKITVGDRTMTAVLEDNPSAEALWELIDDGAYTVTGSNYGGFEKVCSLGTSIERNDTHITTKPGDIVLYQGKNICFYYAENSWDFTMLAHVEDLSDEEIKDILSGPETEVTMERITE